MNNGVEELSVLSESEHMSIFALLEESNTAAKPKDTFLSMTNGGAVVDAKITQQQLTLGE